MARSGEIVAPCGLPTCEAFTVLLMGPLGAGKTHLAVGLGIKAIEQGFAVQFYRFDDLLAQLKRDADVPGSRLGRRKYLSSTLLIIDELGFEPMNRQDAGLFFRLVTYRYNRGANLITTNKPIREWTELLAGDEVLATAILDRLLHYAHVINIRGRSYRLRHLEDALDMARTQSTPSSEHLPGERHRARPNANSF